VRIGLIGKYVQLPDAYLSVVEALKHAGNSAEGIAAALGELPGFVPEDLRHNPAWFRLVALVLERFISGGPRSAVKAELV
jgi:hypothetical protein